MGKLLVTEIARYESGELGQRERGIRYEAVAARETTRREVVIEPPYNTRTLP